MTTEAELYRQLTVAHAEALRVGDSPIYADQLASKVAGIVRALDQAEVGEDARNRIRDALANAERVLRRDDDGREAARHIHIAIGQLRPPPRKPSPFGDD